MAGLGAAAVLVPVWLAYDGIGKKDVIGILLGILALAVAVADYLRGDSGPPLSPAAQADDLARTVEDQWSDEARARRLRDPCVLPLTWTAADPAVQSTADRRVRLRLDGRLNGDFDSMTTQLAEGYRGLPAGRLVAVGEPGSGKTVLAILLALGLLGRRGAGEPVPVLLAASSWDPVSEPLDDWMVRTLADTYYRGRSDTPRALLDHGLLTPILDGLDEIPESARRGAVRAINHALGAERPIVVTCRAVEYGDVIAAGSPTLRRAPVVRVVPLAVADVVTYLRAVDWPDPTTRWDQVYGHLRTAPPDSPVRTALSTPLMVSLARLVHQRLGGSPAELLDLSRFDSRHAVEDHLLDRLIDAAYAPDRLPSGRPTGEPPRWDTAEAHRWLTYLAQYLHRHRERDLAWWQMSQRLLSPWSAPVLGLVLGTTLMAVVTVWLSNSGLWRKSYGVTDAVSAGAAFSSAFSVSALVGTGTAILVVIVWYAATGTAPGQLSLTLRGSLRRLRRGAATGVAVALVPAVPIVLGQAVAISLSKQGWTFGVSTEFFQLLGLVSALALTVGLAVAVHDWLTAQPERAAQITPNQLLRQDRNSAVFGALAAGVVTALITSSALMPVLAASDMSATAFMGWLGEPHYADFLAFRDYELSYDLRTFLIVETAGVLPGAVCAILVFLSRAWPRFRLAALSLAVRGSLPWHLVDFLTEARRRGVLRQSGGVFQFRHIRLQERLNDQPQQQQPAPTRLRRRAIGVAVGIMAVVSVMLVAALPEDGSRATILVRGVPAGNDGYFVTSLSSNGRWLVYLRKRELRSDGATKHDGVWVLDLGSGGKRTAEKRLDDAVSRSLLRGTGLAYALSADGGSLTTVSHRRTGAIVTEVWSVRGANRRKSRCTLPYNGENPPTAISPDGGRLAVGEQDFGGEGRIHLWDLAACQADPITLKVPRSRSTKLEFISFDPTGEAVAASLISDDEDGTNPSTLLWDLSEEGPARHVPGRGKVLYGLALSRHGSSIVFNDNEDQEGVSMWNASYCKEICMIDGHAPLVFDDDGRVLATSSGDEVRLWDAQNGKALEGGTLLASGDVLEIAFGPEARTLTTLTSDGVVKRWGVPRV
ncbi:hypothetical protein [Streptomyces sp. CRN 30]|uniref:NACHT and WD40 repeat domain-containing protein n=1 Tax=Streptomyces sp. CRN 30 TaxID=3075613 RepID=UPI002A82E28B|nr:hypothetical protein [Streptomyces sp. CRN 30]